MNEVKTTKIKYWEKVDVPPHVKDVWDELASNDLDVYVVGGAVRDLLSDRQPTDWDLATNGTPARIRKIFGARNVIQEENNKKFGVTFVQSNGRIVEVATFREDISVGRKTDVRFADDYIPDARRRDFTINALYLDNMGRVHDPNGVGISHINKRRLEFVDIPDERITEDPVRLFRGLRFIAMGYEPTRQTKKALFNNRKHLSLFKNKVKMDYIRKELLKLMQTDIRKGVEILCDSGLMEIILPEFMPIVDFDQKSEYHVYKLDRHSVATAVELKRLYEKNGDELDKELILVGLLHDIAKPDCQELDDEGHATYINHDRKGGEMIGKAFKRLKFPNKSIKRAKVLVENHLVLHQPHTMKNMLKLVDTMTQANLDMRDILWLYKADLHATRGERSYLPDNYIFPSVKPAIKSKEIMALLQSMHGGGYDKKLIGKVQRRMREFYYDFPNIATFKLREKVKDYIRSLKDDE